MGANLVVAIGLGAMLSGCAISRADLEQDNLISIYRCSLEARLPEGGYSPFLIQKIFREDGTVYRMTVQWEDNQGGGLIRPRRTGETATVQLGWSGGIPLFSSTDGEPFVWSKGTVRIYSHGAGWPRPFRNEQWSQSVLDRDGSARILEVEGIETLIVTEKQLLGDLLSASSLEILNMPLDKLLAWGAGVERITVIKSLATRRNAQAEDFRRQPVARRRVVGRYELDLAALRKVATDVREATERWEAEISDDWRQCERDTEGGKITLTYRGGDVAERQRVAGIEAGQPYEDFVQRGRR